MITNYFVRTLLTRTLLAVLFFSLASVSYSQDNIEKGMQAVESGDYLKALELLKNAPKDKYEGNLYYGIALFKTGSVTEAEKFIKAAIKQEDERPEAYSVLGQIYSSQKKYGEAASEFENSKKYLPLNKTKEDLDKGEIKTIIDVLKAEAENFIADGKVDKAIASLTTAKTYDDKNPLIYIGLGDAYLARGAFEPAKTNYDMALKYKANYAPAYYGLGEIAFKQKKYSNSLENYIKSTDADNNYAPAFFKKGLIFYLLDKFTDAIEALERYDQLQPGSLRGKTYIAKAKYGQGKLDEALTILDEVLIKDPSYSEANKYKAYVLIDKKEYSKAEEFFNKVKPEDLNAEDYSKWARIPLANKDYAAAYALLDKALALDANDENVYFEYGKALFAEQKYADALVKFNKAIELGILNVAAYVYSGICYFYMNEFDKGAEILTKSIELSSNVASAWLWRANNYANASTKPEITPENKKTLEEKACSDYKKYLEFEPNDASAQEQVKRFCGQ
jgi:tetratricopeptide (TPR) repeat protein